MIRKATIKLIDFGSIRALASVHIGGLEIRGFKVIDQGDGKPCVAHPSREYIKNGRKEFHSIVRIENKDARQKFHAWLISEYEKARA